MAALTTADKADRDCLENEFNEGSEGFHRRVAILAELKHRRLYKSTHKRFGHYCADVLGFTLSHARSLVGLGSFKTLSDSLAGPEIVIEEGDVVVPSGIELRKSHRAELARLPAPQRQVVLDCAVAIAEKAMPSDAPAPRLTAKIIQEAAAAAAGSDVAASELDIPDQAFVDRPLYVAIQNQLSALKRELTKLSERSSAKFLPLDPLVAALRDVQAGLKHGMPYCWCTDCGGDLEEREDCDTCKGLGFNSLTMFKQADGDQQAGARLWNSATTK